MKYYELDCDILTANYPTNFYLYSRNCSPLTSLSEKFDSYPDKSYMLCFNYFVNFYNF